MSTLYRAVVLNYHFAFWLFQVIELLHLKQLMRTQVCGTKPPSLKTSLLSLEHVFLTSDCRSRR